MSYVPEIDVLIATCIWLHSEGWRIESISVARGQGIDHYQDKQKLRQKMSEENVPFEQVYFISSGADITAKKDSITLKIECKGLSEGQSQTLRNNFDRTIASAVSYFNSRNDLRIGIALPRDSTYIRLIRSRVPRALREAINFWILLYDSNDNSIKSYAPNNGV